MEAPVNHGTSLPFKDLVTDLLQPLQDYTRRPGGSRPGARNPTDLKRTAIHKFIVRWRKEVGPNIFPVFRLLMPDRDKDRAMYKIKEANLAKLFIKILGLSPTSEDANSIEKWKIPGARGAAGDFPGRLYDVLASRPAIPDWGDMTIDEVNEGLDQLSNCSKESQQRPIMTRFYKNMSAKELRWLACIILRSMKIGATERTFFELWHPDAVKLFNKSSSLFRVCMELYDQDYRLPDAEKDISVFSPFQPQLAAFKKENIEDVAKKMNGRMFYIEEKLDGERIQLHYKHGVFRYWSRKANEYTHLYGKSFGDASNQEGGGLTKHLRDAFDKKLSSFVLDGEMITWNDQYDAPVPFGTLKSAAKAERDNENTSLDAHPFYCVFDVLHINGKSLSDYALKERRKALKRIIKPVPRRIEIVEVQEASTAAEIENRLRACVAQASEGLVVKDPGSRYTTNDRNDSWIKVKPEYMSEFGENLDLLIIGGCFGEGRRGNRLTSFVCGLRQDDATSDEPRQHFLSFCRVGGGYGGPDYDKIHHITEGKWHKFDPRAPPSGQSYAMNNGKACEPADMWIAPEDSIVIQIKAAQATPSNIWATAITLRFPRFECVRDDKDWTSALSTKEFVEMQREAQNSHEHKVMTAHIKKKRAVKRKKVDMQVLGEEETRTFAVDPLLSSLFEGLEFYVMSESKELGKSKVELQAMIQSYGGNWVLHEGEPHQQDVVTKKRKRQGEVIVLAERMLIKVAALIKRATHDIYKPAFLQRCIAAGRILDTEPSLLFYATPETAASVEKGTTDEFGDSWTNELDTAALKQLSQKMSSRASENDIIDLKSQLIARLDDLPPLWLFARHCAYFDGTTDLENARSIFAAAGGTTVELEHADLTTVITKRGSTALSRIRESLSERERTARVVDESWIHESWLQGTIYAEQRYST